MLPVELSNGICSLNAGEDRFALSCSMEIDPKGNVISSDVYKSVIRVTERMSYTDVNKIINYLDEEVTKKYNKYINNFKLMEELAVKIGARSSSFANPHGLDNKEHYSSCYDLAILTDYALKNETFNKIVSTDFTNIYFNTFSR